MGVSWSSISSFICGVSALVSKDLMYRRTIIIYGIWECVYTQKYVLPYHPVHCWLHCFSGSAAGRQHTVKSMICLFFFTALWIEHTFLGWLMFSRNCFSSWYLQIVTLVRNIWFLFKCLVPSQHCLIFSFLLSQEKPTTSLKHLGLEAAHIEMIQGSLKVQIWFV